MKRCPFDNWELDLQGKCTCYAPPCSYKETNEKSKRKGIYSKYSFSKCNYKVIVKMSDGDDEIDGDEIMDYCYDNFNDDWTCEPYFNFTTKQSELEIAFKNEDDAILFKLTWC